MHQLLLESNKEICRDSTDTRTNHLIINEDNQGVNSQYIDEDRRIKAFFSIVEQQNDTKINTNEKLIFSYHFQLT